MNESFRSIRWDWVGFGWFIAVAIASLLVLGFWILGLVGADGEVDTLWLAVAVAVGFFVTGLWVGTRVVAAPLLHGVAMALVSLLAWVLVNLLVGEAIGETTWGDLDVPGAVGLLVLQAAAAGIGARIGVRRMRRTPDHL